MDQQKRSAGVIGGGISGLSTAWYLVQRGIGVTLYERENRVGGSIHTRSEGDWLVDEGPNTLMVRDRRIRELLEALHLTGEVVEAGSGAKNRFIVKGGRLEPLPRSPVELLRTPLLSAKAKGRLLTEPFRRRSVDPEESIASFVKRRMGREVLDYLVNPFVAGIFAGDPERLSIRHTLPKLWAMEQEHGSLLRGMIRGGKRERAQLISFRGGMSALPEALAARLGDRIILNAPVHGVDRNGEGRWRIAYGDGKEAVHDAVVLASPPSASADILPPDRKTALLREIPFAPLSVIATGFRAGAVGHPLDGFGMLVPEREPSPLLGTLFSSSLFPGRAPEGYRLLTHFVGGDRQPELAGLDQAELLERILPELNSLLGIDGKPEVTFHRHWPRAIPQYTRGYDRYLETVGRLKGDGLFFSGNYLGGVSLPDCITSGDKTAEGVAAFLENPV